MKTGTFVVIALCGAATAFAQGSQLPAPQETPRPAATPPGAVEPVERTAYRLGPDDQIVIQVADVPDISGKTQRLDPNGDVRLPMIGRLHAGGMTLEQFETELRTRLKEYLNDPDVAVTVTEFKSQPVTVIGAVGASGVRQLEGRKTLIEMLSLAGGVTADAGPIVRVARRADAGALPVAGATVDSTGFTVVDIDLKGLLDAQTPGMNIVIRPNDVISVPRAALVFVIGEVGRPGPVPLSVGTSVSVMEAVSSAGGTLRTAKSSKARILRREVGTQARTEVAVDLQQMMAGKANDMSLAPGDILIIPGKGSNRAVARVLEAALQAGVMIGTYGIVR